MRRLLEIALTGLVSVRLHPLRSLVSFLAVLVVLVPFLVGVALAEGLEADAEASARLGADLYVKGPQFRRPVPVPPKAVDKIRQIKGVKSVVPRIVGEVVLGKENVHAVLVGLPPEHFPDWVDCVDGRLPFRGQRPGPNELVLGTTLA